MKELIKDIIIILIGIGIGGIVIIIGTEFIHNNITLDDSCHNGIVISHYQEINLINDTTYYTLLKKDDSSYIMCNKKSVYVMPIGSRYTFIKQN